MTPCGQDAHQQFGQMFIVQATRFENAFVEIHPMWVLLNAQQ